MLPEPNYHINDAITCQVYYVVLGMINVCPKLIAFADLQLI